MSSRIIIVICLILSTAYSLTVRKDENTRIAGGTPTLATAGPYMVSIRVQNTHKCGGSILNNHWILTAAQCFDHNYLPLHYTVVVGSLALAPGGVTHYVDKFITHENYDAKNKMDDIALIKLLVPITLSANVQPVQLPTRLMAKPHHTEVCTLTGWGASTNNGPLMPALQSLEMYFYEQTDCIALNAKYPITNRHICAASRLNAGPCNGDGGGPLVVLGKPTALPPTLTVQHGVYSWSTACFSGKPDVFTNVQTYLDWIGYTLASN